ncbi:MAG: hypothetical protein KUG79_05360 [Pseudomonadales bacterium]|nr:hypothetical protein [Pseudomonadales bacterium]
MSTIDKWNKEKKAVRAVQVAFDLGQEVSHRIRYEALEKGINPPDRIREILGLPVSSKPVRPRLSISLTAKDFELLALIFDVPVADKLKIRQLAAEKLVAYIGSRPEASA